MVKPALAEIKSSLGKLDSVNTDVDKFFGKPYKVDMTLAEVKATIDKQSADNISTSTAHTDISNKLEKYINDQKSADYAFVKFFETHPQLSQLSPKLKRPLTNKKLPATSSMGSLRITSPLKICPRTR